MVLQGHYPQRTREFKTVADKHFFDRYVAPTPIAAATLDARGAVGSLAAEDLDYWLGESSSVYAIGMST